MKGEFDIYQCVNNIEIRDFFRRNETFSMEEQMQLILHSYQSAQGKRENLYKLSLGAMGTDLVKVEEMILLFDICIKQIFKPEGRVLYVSERNRFYDDMGQLLQEIERDFRPEGSLNQEEYVYQITFNEEGTHQVAMEYEMTWLDGKLQVIRFFPNTEWLRKKGVAQNTIDVFEDSFGVCHKQLPFENGCRIRMKTPIMEAALHGEMECECDAFGYWYYFLRPDGNNQQLIDLSYHEIDLTSGYAVFDWVERE